tara:strand:+ start:5753 stop:5929 length:177 start_codon:yes stop_codon:yes gene_type:complete
MFNQVEIVQVAYEDAVDAVMIAANCDEDEAIDVVETITTLIVEALRLKNGEDDASIKH